MKGLYILFGLFLFFWVLFSFDPSRNNDVKPPLDNDVKPPLHWVNTTTRCIGGYQFVIAYGDRRICLVQVMPPTVCGE